MLPTTGTVRRCPSSSTRPGWRAATTWRGSRTLRVRCSHRGQLPGADPVASEMAARPALPPAFAVSAVCQPCAAQGRRSLPALRGPCRLCAVQAGRVLRHRQAAAGVDAEARPRRRADAARAGLRQRRRRRAHCQHAVLCGRGARALPCARRARPCPRARRGGGPRPRPRAGGERVSLRTHKPTRLRLEPATARGRRKCRSVLLVPTGLGGAPQSCAACSVFLSRGRAPP